MRRVIVIHASLVAAFCLLYALINRWFSLTFLQFIFGAITAMILPFIDHFIYVFFSHPEELTSQRVRELFKKSDIIKGMQLLMATTSERTNLIFHTAHFQLIFLLVTFFVMTSSATTYGKGLVLTMSLHFVIDQAIEYLNHGSIDRWFTQVPFDLTPIQQKNYIYVITVLVLVLGFVL
jgi:hypothetical protein